MKAIKEAIQKLKTMGSLPASLQSMLEAALREDAARKFCDCNQGRLPCTCKPADQRQGEPVKLPERKTDHLSDSVHGWNACLEEIAKLGPLYTRPVQGDAKNPLETERKFFLAGQECLAGVKAKNSPQADPSATVAYLDEAGSINSFDCDAAELAGGRISLSGTPDDQKEIKQLRRMITELEGERQSQSRTMQLLKWALRLIADGWSFEKFKGPRVCSRKQTINIGLPGSERENLCIYSDDQNFPEEMSRALTEFENCRVIHPNDGFQFCAPVEADQRAKFEKDFSTKGRPLTRADYDPNGYWV